MRILAMRSGLRFHFRLPTSAFPRSGTDRQGVDSTARHARVHLRMRRQAQSSSTGNHRPRLALAQRQKPVEALQAAFDPGPFGLELRNLYFQQTRATGMPAISDQNRIRPPLKPDSRKGSHHIAPHGGLGVGQFSWRWHRHGLTADIDDDSRQIASCFPAALTHFLLRSLSEKVDD